MTSGTRLVARGRGVFYGWWMIVASATLLTYHSGAWWYGFGVLLKPIAAEFNWSRATIAAAFSITNLEGGFLAPVSGWLIDRFGPRIVILGGVLLLCAGFISLSLINSLLAYYLTYALLMGFGAQASGVSTHLAVAARWFVRRRAQAMGYVTIGGGLGGILVTPLVALFVETYGWRTTAVAIAAGMLLVGLPVAAIMRPGRPEAYGLRPDGDLLQPAGAPASAHLPGLVTSGHDFTVGEALRSRAFWLLVLAWALNGAATPTMAVHLVPLLTDKGLSATVAASAVPVLAIMTLPSRFIFPWFADRYDVRPAYAGACLFFAAGLLMLLTGPDLWLVYVAVGLFGLGQGGAIPLRPAATAAYFGRERFGTIQGLMNSFGNMGTMLGPIITGAIFDATGSYALALVLLAAACLAAAAVITSAPRTVSVEPRASLAPHRD